MAAKAALCICPPALLATGVATVPSVKRAVHHVTADRRPAKAIGRPAKASARPGAVARVQEDCDPGLGGALPEVPLVTYASPIADEPGGVSGSSFGGGGPLIAALGIGSGGGGGAAPVTPPVPLDPGAGAIPEPSVWLMMIVGAGTLGAGMRLRRRRSAGSGRHGHGGAGRGLAGGALWSGSVAVEAGDLATTVAVKSAVASAAGKALLCVCPAAIVAGSVMTVPPLRQAVHASTAAPATFAPSAAPPMRIAQPCTEVMTVPVASSAIEGLPALIQTMPVVMPVTVVPLRDGSMPSPQTI